MCRVLMLLQDYEPPSGKLQKAIEEEFGSVDKLTTKIDDAAKGIQASSADYIHKQHMSGSAKASFECQEIMPLGSLVLA